MPTNRNTMTKTPLEELLRICEMDGYNRPQWWWKEQIQTAIEKEKQVNSVDLADVGERSSDYKLWWAAQDDVNRCSLIKDKSIEVNRLHKRMVKASDARMTYGFNRSGQRGGKFTSLAAHEERCTEAYLEAVNEFKYMTRTL